MRRLLPLVVLGLACASAAASSSPAQPVAATTLPSNERQTVATPACDESPMDLDRLDRAVRELDSDAQRDGRVWQLSHASVQMAVVTDPKADRMRILSPVARVADLQPEVMAVLLEANYHRALDARYATSDGIVYAVYIHPLGALENAQVRSGIEQVANLVRTFGSTFSSTDLSFGGR